MTTQELPPSGAPSGTLARITGAMKSVCRRLLESLPGQLLMITIAFVAMGLVLVYFPATASFRLQWMTDRAEAAHLAALAADVAPGGALGEEEVRALLMGADAVAVSRVRNGMNELVLYSGPIGERPVESDLRTANLWTHIRDTVDALTAPPGRLLRIRAEQDVIDPVTQEQRVEVIDVIVKEQPLRAALIQFSRRLLLYSVLIALLAGGLIYASLFFMFVRPMRKLAGAMIRFRDAPEDPTRTIVPHTGANEIAQAEQELARMQADIRLALQQRERLAALGEAVAKINHDLRNVLASAQLVSDRLAMDSDDRVRKMGERLVRSVDRGVRLCQATLEYGRAEDIPPASQTVPAQALVEEAAGDAMLSEGSIDWSNQVDANITIHVDPDHAHRIFLNLFRNAIQAMKSNDPEGGAGTLSVSAHPQGDAVHLWVRDTGPGLPAKARENLFKAFTGSARKGGTGLGLTIAQELARGHGGDLVLVESTEDGTVFAVVLPVAGE